MVTLLRRMSGCAALLAVAVTVSAIDRAATADEPRWTVDPKMSRITFTGRQMGVPSKGEFKTFSAAIQFDPANLAGSAVEVVIDTASADTGNRDIDQELKRPNWFEVDRFPQARFVTTSLRGKGGNAYEAAARLTIRDITQDVVLPFVVEISPDSADPAQLLARASGELTISRSHYGIGRAEWRDTKIVADEILIRIEVVARRKK